MDRRKPNNRGFSLIELVITAAILAVVTLTVSLMMSSGTGLYRSLNTMAGLQYQSQVCMAQLQEYSLDVNGGIARDGDTIYFTVYENETEGKVYRLTYDSTMQALLFDEGSVSVDPAGSELTYTYHSEPVTLCGHVSDYRAEINYGSDTGFAESISLTLTLADRGKSYTVSQVFAFRNRPAIISADANITEALLTRVWFGEGAGYTYTTTVLNLSS